MHSSKGASDIALWTGSGGGRVRSIDFASYGTADIANEPDCATWGASACHASSSVSVVEERCLHQTRCSIAVNSSLFGGDPCPFHAKSLAIRATCAGGFARKRLASDFVLREGRDTIWSGSEASPSAVPGVVAVRRVADGVEVDVWSGDYHFESALTELIEPAATEGPRVPHMSVMTFWTGGGYPCLHWMGESEHRLHDTCPSYAADLRSEHEFVTMRGLRGNDRLEAQLNGSDWVYRTTGLPGIVSYDKLWPGALWPYAKNMSWDEGWNEAIRSISNFSSIIRPYITNGSVSTIFLGDEMCCPSGCQDKYGKGHPDSLTRVNFTRNSSAILHELRKRLGPKPIFYLNTCPDWQPEKWPADLDLFSIDYCKLVPSTSERQPVGTYSVGCCRPP